MAIISCPCGQRLRVPDKCGGRRIACPECGETIVVSDRDQDDLSALCEAAGESRSNGGNDMTPKRPKPPNTLGIVMLIVALVCVIGLAVGVVHLVLNQAGSAQQSSHDGPPHRVGFPVPAGDHPGLGELEGDPEASGNPDLFPNIPANRTSEDYTAEKRERSGAETTE
ncbi:MAG: hypothetical protein ACOC3J_00490 [Gemmatimonadota bacterium]